MIDVVSNLLKNDNLRASLDMYWDNDLVHSRYLKKGIIEYLPIVMIPGTFNFINRVAKKDTSGFQHAT